MIIEGVVELSAFTGLYKRIYAGQVESMQRVVDTWFENKAYTRELMDAVIDPAHLIYNSGTWSELSAPEVIEAKNGYILFHVSVDFETPGDKEDFIDDMDDADWQEIIEISSGYPDAPWDYTEFEVSYDILQNAE